MRKRTFYLLALPLVLTVSGLFLFQTPAVSEEGCVTAQCHPTLLKGKDVHPAAQGGCDTCHESTAKPHPQPGKKTFKLVQEPPALCAMCHTPFGKKPNIHPPVKDGMCTTCHNPHSSDQQKLLAQPMKDLCLTCHSDKASFKYLHGPASAGDCTACHTPHESDNKRLLLKEQPDLCFGCHTDMQEALKKKTVHPAVLGGCTSCHNPHGGPYKKFLSAEGEKLCAQCHAEMVEKIGKAKVVHPAVMLEKGCATCHSPHAGDNEKLLVKSGKDLCFECHKDVIKKNMTVIHGPIKAGGCTPCHSPHASQYDKLLVKEFPEDMYVPYTDNEYELCFSCHNRDLLRYPETSFATGFRDGERNLHYLHVNKKDKGRSCKICHNIHGGTNPKLIADSAPFGKWALPIKFTKTDTGGRCAPGCHKPYSYDRKTPGKTPEAAKPKAEEKGKEEGKEKK
ncbi:MAG: cytochrome C [Nitrospirae bacterium]|nr:cytochrome C [Nitrospirota bacterium]